MDTSETYIKMCEKAKEIQEQWKPKMGDYIAGEWYIDKEDTIGLCCKGIIKRLSPEGHIDCVDTGGDIFWNIGSHIWLPRQDQLQEMVGDYHQQILLLGYYTDIITGDDARMHIGSSDYDYWSKFTSMEQLWLAFVMKEKYKKIWDGTAWK